MWISIPALQRRHRVHKGRKYGDKTRKRLAQGEFGEQNVTWRLVASQKHKYEVNEKGARRIVAFCESQSWTGTA